MSELPEPSIILNLNTNAEKFARKIIPTFQIPYVHRDMWNDKEWYYSIEGKSGILYQL